MKLTHVTLLAGTIASALFSTPSPVTWSRCSSAMAARRQRGRGGQQSAQPHRRQRGHRRHPRRHQAPARRLPPPRVDQREHGTLISAFNLSQGSCWSRPGSQGASPQCLGRCRHRRDRRRPLPQVYDLMALDERTRSAVLGKYGRMHVNSAEDGTDIDEVMTVVSGGRSAGALPCKTAASPASR